MRPIIGPVAPALLRSELEAQPPLERWRNFEIYGVRGDECPSVMLEIGRSREQAFREVGAGRGGEVDLDELDFGPNAYGQLVVWDPVHGELVAAVRYMDGEGAARAGELPLRTSSLFEYSPAFRASVLPHAFELGRSIVCRGAKRAALGLFALWRGLASLVRARPGIRYFFGNVSIYASYEAAARARLVALVEALYAPPAPMLVARPGLRFAPSPALALDASAAGHEPASRVRFLREAVGAHGERLPPILISYLGLSADVWCGETAVDADFADALEVGIIVPLDRVDAAARARFGLEVGCTPRNATDA